MCADTWTAGGEKILPDSTKGRPVYRLIPSSYPPIKLFENLLDPDELDLAYELEGLTNDRLRDEVGQITLVAKQDRLVGPGTSVIMAAFTHIGAESRFGDGSYGVYYAALSVKTAKLESCFSRARFYSATNEAACTMIMRCYKCVVAVALQDIRGDGFDHLHRPDSWQEGQKTGSELKAHNSWGLWYRSVRDKGGECIAAFRPKALTPPALQTTHSVFRWDGATMTVVE